jgi:hypothetical protein
VAACMLVRLSIIGAVAAIIMLPPRCTPKGFGAAGPDGAFTSTVPLPSAALLTRCLYLYLYPAVPSTPAVPLPCGSFTAPLPAVPLLYLYLYLYPRRCRYPGRAFTLRRPLPPAVVILGGPPAVPLTPAMPLRLCLYLGGAFTSAVPLPRRWRTLDVPLP